MRAPDPEERFLVLAPTGRDGPLTCQLLDKAGLSCCVCDDVEELCRRFDEQGAAALLIAEETLVPSSFARLTQSILKQETWSDIPILIFTGVGALIQSRPPTAQLLDPLGN